MYLGNSSNLDDARIVDLPLYAIISSFHDKIGSIEEDKEKTQMTQGFPILVPSFFLRCEEYNLLLLVLRNGFFYRSIYIPVFLQSFIWINILI